MPEDAEIGTDGDGLALLAILGTNIHLLEVGRIPNADELYAVLGGLMQPAETGVIIVTYHGYISGIPSLFSTDVNTAFIFKNKEQAETVYRRIPR